MRPIIALLTDFGTRDHYVGALKGAILSIAPDAQVVDVLHEVAAHDVEGGAFALGAAYPAFPEGAVFVAVVDPGVGSSRRGLAVEGGSYRFVGPDNGLLTAVLDDHPTARVHALTNRRLWRDEVASTFHARDVFGPVAAHLALGVGLAEVGPAVADALRLPLVPVRALGGDEWEATIVQVDRFGNLTSNLTGRALDGILVAAGAGRSDVVVLLAGMVAPLVVTYSDVPTGEPCALVGSSGRLEVAVNGGSAASLTGADRGARMRIRRVYQPAI
jgi:S-adenosyl-L-methionine hydrolase (adenosine-forming)